MMMIVSCVIFIERNVFSVASLFLYHTMRYHLSATAIRLQYSISDRPFGYLVIGENDKKSYLKNYKIKN